MICSATSNEGEDASDDDGGDDGCDDDGGGDGGSGDGGGNVDDSLIVEIVFYSLLRCVSYTVDNEKLLQHSKKKAIAEHIEHRIFTYPLTDAVVERTKLYFAFLGVACFCCV